MGTVRGGRQAQMRVRRGCAGQLQDAPELLAAGELMVAAVAWDGADMSRDMILAGIYVPSLYGRPSVTLPSEPAGNSPNLT